MSILRQGLSKASQPVTGRLDAGTSKLEHLIHAIKNEIVGLLNEVKGQNNDLFDSVNDQLALSRAQSERMAERIEGLGELRRETSALRDEIGFLREAMEARFESVAPSVRLRNLSSARLAEIDAPASGFLNYAHSHRGPLSDVGLWLNPPIVLEWLEGDARVGAVNERIIEQPFAFAALCRLPPGASILDIGGGESVMAFSLASLGYHVTVVEPQGYPLDHPNLRVLEQPLEDCTFDEPFDAVLLLSAIEHFGIGHYKNNPDADERADLEAMKIVRRILDPSGLLVLTTPYGPYEINDVERIYDEARLAELIDGFTVETAAIGKRDSSTSWTLESHDLQPPAGPGRVVMLTARPATAS